MKTKTSEKKSLYDISVIDFINVVCLDGNVYLVGSLSNVVAVAILVNDDDDVS
jgi:hypothetical protein